MLQADHVDSSTSNEGVHWQNSDKCGEILKERTGMGKGWVYGPLIGSKIEEPILIHYGSERIGKRTYPELFACSKISKKTWNLLFYSETKINLEPGVVWFWKFSETWNWTL